MVYYYERVKQELELTGTGKMKCFGNSMLPLLKSGSLLTFNQVDTYENGWTRFVYGKVILGEFHNIPIYTTAIA